MVEGGGVHVSWLMSSFVLKHLELLGGQSQGEEAEDEGVQQGDDGQGEGPADATGAQLIIVCLGTTHSPHLVIVPASGEGEQTNQETEARQKLKSATDLEHVRGSKTGMELFVLKF